MSEVQATFTVDGVSFASKKEAVTYAKIKSGLEEAGYTNLEFLGFAMEAYLAGLFQVPKKTRAKKA